MLIAYTKRPTQVAGAIQATVNRSRTIDGVFLTPLSPLLFDQDEMCCDDLLKMTESPLAGNVTGNSRCRMTEIC